MTRDGRQEHRSQVRLPSDLASYLKQKAEDNSRSLNSEIAHRLKQSRAQEEGKHATAAP